MLVNRILSVVVAIAAASLALNVRVAHAADMSSYGQIGWWKINIHSNRGACSASANFELNQSVGIRLGSDLNDPLFVISSPGVNKLRLGDDFPLAVMFDDGNTYRTNGEVQMASGTKFLNISITRNMLGSFMRASNMYIYAGTIQGRQLVATMNLQYSYAALMKVVECQALLDSNRPSRPRTWSQAERQFSM